MFTDGVNKGHLPKMAVVVMELDNSQHMPQVYSFLVSSDTIGDENVKRGLKTVLNKLENNK